MAKSRVLPRPRMAHIIGGPLRSTGLLIKEVTVEGGREADAAWAAATSLQVCRLAYSAAKPRKISPAIMTVKAKMRAEGLYPKSESSMQTMMRKVTNINTRSHLTRFSLRSVLQAPRLVAMAPTTPTA